MRIIIAGSRKSTRAQMSDATTRCEWLGFATAVVSGTAIGADRFGEEWAEVSGLPVHPYPADWPKHGKAAGHIRNRQMAENAEGLLAVWDGESPGTRDMINQALELGLRVAVWRTDFGRMDYLPPDGRIADAWRVAEERAAIKEFCGGLPRAYAERTASLQPR